MIDKQIALIAQLKKGEEDAYKYLFERYYDFLCRYALYFVRDCALAEAVTSDVIFKLWQNREQIEITTSLICYLKVSVKNGCLNHLKSRVVKNEIAWSKVPNCSEIIETQQIEDQEIDNQQMIKVRVQNALDTLPEKTKEIFLMCRVNGYSYEQAAKEMQISIHTVKYHITNAQKILHIQLKEYL